MNKKKIVTDVILNIAASAIPIFVLQFIILPVIASMIDSGSYGRMLTIVSLINLSAASMGNILNNSRLISFKKYEESELEGDFNILLLVLTIINVIIVIFGVWYYEKAFNLVNIILVLSASILLLLNGYGVVEFRIKLNYKNILFNEICLVIGYLLGSVLFIITGYWQLIYLCGFAFSFIYIKKKTTIFTEEFHKTELFNKTAKQTLFLLVSGLLLNAAVYIDRLLLYPLLGGTAVSIFYTATILGKTVSLAIQPASGVLLSYFAQMKKLNNKYFVLFCGTSFGIGIIGYIIVILISRPVLSFLYPQFVNEALEYIYIATLAIMINIVCGVVNPAVLKFCSSKWQLAINLSYLFIYVGSTVILMNFYGLMGFCIGILIANSIKLLLMLIIFYFVYMRAEIN